MQDTEEGEPQEWMRSDSGKMLKREAAVEWIMVFCTKEWEHGKDDWKN